MSAACKLVCVHTTQLLTVPTHTTHVATHVFNISPLYCHILLCALGVCHHTMLFFAMNQCVLDCWLVGVQPLVPAACSVAPQLTPGLTPQGLCNVLWAMTMLAGHVPSAVLDPIQEACLRMDLDRFGSVSIATLIGAFTRHGSMPMELAVALNRAVVRTLPKFAGDNLCK